MARNEPATVAAADVVEAAAAVARAVRLKRPDDERQARIELARAHGRVFQLKASEQFAQAQLLEDEAKKTPVG